MVTTSSGATPRLRKVSVEPGVVSASGASCSSIFRLLTPSSGDAQDEGRRKQFIGGAALASFLRKRPDALIPLSDRVFANFGYVAGGQEKRP